MTSAVRGCCRWALVCSAVLVACQPSFQQQAVPRRVAYISVLPESYDQANMAQLKATLARAKSRIGPVTVVAHRLEGSTADADKERLVELAMRDGPWSLIVVSTTGVAVRVQRHDPDTPIVFEGSSEVVSFCLVDSLLRPGRNATGYTSYLPAEPKMAEALIDAYPKVQQVVVLVDGTLGVRKSCRRGAALGVISANCRSGDVDPSLVEDEVEAEALESYLLQRNRRARFVRLCGQADLARLADIVGSDADIGIVVPYHDLFHAEALATVAAVQRLGRPAVYPRHSFLAHGALMTMAPVVRPIGERQTDELAVRILGGERPQDLPVVVPDGFELRFNLKAASNSHLIPKFPTLQRAHMLVEQ